MAMVANIIRHPCALNSAAHALSALTDLQPNFDHTGLTKRSGVGTGCRVKGIINAFQES